MQSAAQILDTPRGLGATRLPRRHVLMLALAVEILAVGLFHADRYQRSPTIAIDAPSAPGHMIT